MTHRRLQCKLICLVVANVLLFETDIATFKSLMSHFQILQNLVPSGEKFTRVIFLKFYVDLISRIGYRWIFREDLFSQILVLSMFYIF